MENVLMRDGLVPSTQPTSRKAHPTLLHGQTHGETLKTTIHCGQRTSRTLTTNLTKATSSVSDTMAAASTIWIAKENAVTFANTTKQLNNAGACYEDRRVGVGCPRAINN